MKKSLPTKQSESTEDEWEQDQACGADRDNDALGGVDVYVAGITSSRQGENNAQRGLGEAFGEEVERRRVGASSDNSIVGSFARCDDMSDIK